MLISIIIPYNKSRGFLEQAIKSVNEQTYNDFELIVQQGDCSVGKNFNDGLKKAKGELIRFLAEDDLLNKKSLEYTYNYFKDNNVDFIHSNAISFGKLNNIWEPPIKIPSYKDLIKRNPIHGGTVVYKAHCFKNKKMDEELMTAEEYDLNLWLLKNNYKIGYLNKITYEYRIHDEQKSQGLKTNQKWRTQQKNIIKNRYI